MFSTRMTWALIALAAAVTFLPACNAGFSQTQEHLAPAVGAAGEQQALHVVATTSIVSDVVAQVGGRHIELFTLLPLDADPHSYEPTPQDVARISDADLIFTNGAGLEEFLQDLIVSAGVGVEVVPVSEGVELLAAPVNDAGEVSGKPGEEHQGAFDPHTWTDPNNVIIWVVNIERALSEIDPANAAAYQSNARTYRAQLQELDAWIRTKVVEIPPGNREIVSDHTFLTYFAQQYGFKQLGAVVPATSTLAEPSARELAAIEDTIRDLGVKAIFVGTTASPNLSQRVAEDTGVQLVAIYTGSLTPPEGEAGSYLDYMRYNVSAIVDALR